MEEVIEGAKGQHISESQSMRDFGADSLEVVEVVSRSMKQLRLKVQRAELGGAKNLKDLLDLFEKAAEASGR
jgi:acyl carrier protein